MNEPRPGLYAVVMPTLAAAVLAPMDAVALLTEVAIWSPWSLPCKTVLGLRQGRPVGLLNEPITVPDGYTVLYGRTAADARDAATDHAHRLSEAVMPEPAYDEALQRIGVRLGVSRRDVDLATERYATALAGALDAR